MLENEFLEWLRSKDPNEEYSFYDRESCALAQFGRFYLGHDDVYGSAISFKDFKNKSEYVVWSAGESSDGTAYEKVKTLIHSTTFGELLTKLENL